MTNLSIEATNYSPHISMDYSQAEISIVGKSYPENTFEFYKPVMDWIEEYFISPKPQTTINMEIVYFNSSSSKLFFDFFDILEENRDKSDIIINWIYDEDNDTALEAGEEFMEDFEKLNFNLIEKLD
jgi:hypothetical protein